jgi:hypothetical protein
VTTSVQVPAAPRGVVERELTSAEAVGLAAFAVVPVASGWGLGDSSVRPRPSTPGFAVAQPAIPAVVAADALHRRPVSGRGGPDEPAEVR